MPDINVSVSVIVTLVGMVFSAGITWGVMSSRQNSNEAAQKTSDNKIDSVVNDLKGCVHKLESLATDIQVMKSTSTRFDKDIEDHDKRIGNLEVAVAKYGRSARRKS